MNEIEKAIEGLKGLNERSSKESELFKERHGRSFDLAISALEKQQKFNEYMKYMKQLAEDETKPLEDRQFAEKFAICFEDFL